MGGPGTTGPPTGDDHAGWYKKWPSNFLKEMETVLLVLFRDNVCVQK